MSTTSPDVLVIGAGISGLVAARALSRAGLSVEVLEKSRGLGGRAATRTVHGARVDHGAQFLTVRDPRFHGEVAGWLAEGVVTPWADGIATWTADAGWHHPDPHAHPRYASPAGMSALAQRLASDLAVVRSTAVRAVRPAVDGWHLELDGGEFRRAPRVVLTAPVPQAIGLLAGVPVDPAVRATLDAVAYAPCFAVIAGYRTEAAPAWPGVRFADHPDLAWIGHDSSKRVEPAQTVLVLHATPEFSRRRFEDPAEDQVRDLLRAAAEAVPWADRPSWTDHQRWRYAQTELPHPQPCAVLADGLVLAGDGFGGGGAGRIEAAFLSGMAAAEVLAGSARQPFGAPA